MKQAKRWKNHEVQNYYSNGSAEQPFAVSFRKFLKQNHGLTSWYKKVLFDLWVIFCCVLVTVCLQNMTHSRLQSPRGNFNCRATPALTNKIVGAGRTTIFLFSATIGRCHRDGVFNFEALLHFLMKTLHWHMPYETPDCEDLILTLCRQVCQ